MSVKEVTVMDVPAEASALATRSSSPSPARGAPRGRTRFDYDEHAVHADAEEQERDIVYEREVNRPNIEQMPYADPVARPMATIPENVTATRTRRTPRPTC